MVGVRAAWHTLTQPNGQEPRRLPKGSKSKYAAGQKSVPPSQTRAHTASRLSPQPRSAGSERSRATPTPRPELPPSNQPEASFPPPSQASASDRENPTEASQ
jgi:hypothetical protein